MNLRSVRSYLVVLSAMTAVVVGAMAAANYVVDPYFMNGAVRKVGFNLVKPALARKTYLHVAWRLHSVRADTLVLGTSRAEIGIDPTGAGFGDAPAYNAAIGGASIYASWRYFQHALAFHKVKRLLLGLDFFAFNEIGQKDRVPEDIMLRGAPTILDRARLGLIAFKTYVSLDTLLDSLMTLRSQGWRKGGLKDEHGLMTPPHSSRTLYANFRNNISAFLEGIWFPGKEHQFILRAPTRAEPGSPPGHTSKDAPANAFDYLNAILATAGRENIEVFLFVSPHHAYLLEALRDAGLWDKYETWKRHLAGIAAEWPGVALWDFSGYSRFTTEPVPGPDDGKARMRWHLEASHYSPELGDLVVRRIFGVPAPGQDIGAFGVQLRPDTLPAHLETVRADREAYIAAEGARIREILAAAHRMKRYTAPDAPATTLPIK